jgi:hypothetical protein
MLYRVRMLGDGFAKSKREQSPTSVISVASFPFSPKSDI